MASITARRNLDKKAEELFKETHCKYYKQRLFRVPAQRFSDFDCSVAPFFETSTSINNSSSSVTMFMETSRFIMYYCIVCLIGLPKFSLLNRSVKVFDYKFENMTADKLLAHMVYNASRCDRDFSSIPITVYRHSSSYRFLNGSRWKGMIKLKIACLYSYIT